MWNQWKLILKLRRKRVESLAGLAWPEGSLRTFPAVCRILVFNQSATWHHHKHHFLSITLFSLTLSLIFSLSHSLSLSSYLSSLILLFSLSPHSLSLSPSLPYTLSLSYSPSFSHSHSFFSLSLSLSFSLPLTLSHFPSLTCLHRQSFFFPISLSLLLNFFFLIFNLLLVTFRS